MLKKTLTLFTTIFTFGSCIHHTSTVPPDYYQQRAYQTIPVAEETLPKLDSSDSSVKSRLEYFLEKSLSTANCEVSGTGFSCDYRLFAEPKIINGQQAYVFKEFYGSMSCAYLTGKVKNSEDFVEKRRKIRVNFKDSFNILYPHIKSGIDGLVYLETGDPESVVEDIEFCFPEESEAQEFASLLKRLKK